MKKKHWKIDPISLFSHELKTPLSSLRLAIGLLEKDFNKHKNMLGLMKGEVEKMIAFITDNLDLRFIQERKDLFQWEWKNFESILSETLSSLKILAQKEQVSFHVKKDKLNKELELFIDSSWMKRLLENLLSNAICFSPQAGKIYIEYGLNSKNRFFFSVKDEGPGILDSKKVFDPFYKQALSGKKNFKNTGLGLSIAQAIVSAHGGNIKATALTQGTEFCFTLPKVRILKQSA